MAQMSSGLYRLLEGAGMYEWLQRSLGATRARRRIAEELIRASEGDRLLDIGCGAGSLLDDLPDGVTYFGYDLNPRYIEAARRRYGSRGTFVCARVGEDFAREREFDLVVARGVIHHLDDSEASLLMRSALQHLRPGGHLITIDPVFHSGQSPFARAFISRDRGRNVRTAERYRVLAEAVFPSVETRLLTDLLLVPYSHFSMRARKEA